MAHRYTNELPSNFEANEKELEESGLEMELDKNKDPLALTTENKGYDYKKLQCLHCVLRFKSAKDMKSHINIVHRGWKYQCNLCEYICKQPYQLKLHLEGPKHEADVMDPAYMESLDYCKKQIEKLQNYKKKNYIMKNYMKSIEF